MYWLKNNFLSLLFTLVLFIPFVVHSQDETNLISELELDEEAPQQKVQASFKTTRVVNSHSLETTHKRVLDVRISHRFGQVNSGVHELFGLDQATMRIGFDYGIFKNLSIGVGRSTYEKTYDGFIKYKPLWQNEGNNKMPISLLVVSGMSINTLKFDSQAIGFEMTFPRRLNFFNQLIIGRKFSPNFSLQIMPTHIHRNLVATRQELNSIWAVGTAARYKITKRIAVNTEYYYIEPQQLAGSINPHSFALGFDIETGGHVFQIFCSNAIAFIEKSFIAQNTTNFFQGDIHLGFTISRVFDL